MDRALEQNVINTQNKRPLKLIPALMAKPKAKLLCVCIPHAGGGGHTFHDWIDLLGTEGDLRAAQLPGRGRRFADPAYRSMATLARDLAEEISGSTEKPLVLFGHSLGALIAFETARALFLNYGKVPQHIIVAGASAPHVPEPPNSILRLCDRLLPDGELAHKLRSLGGPSFADDQDPELLSLSLEIIRTDLELHASYEAPAVPEECQLSCPITALGGTSDIADIPEASLEEWGRYTSSGFRYHMLPGDHFFHFLQSEFIAHRILEAISDSAAVP